MSVVYSDYSKDRNGWMFGLTTWQGVSVAVSVLPMFIAISQQAWASAGLGLLGSALVIGLVVVPVRGRSAVAWVAATLSFTLGTLAGWTRFRSRAAKGRADDPDKVDLPGVVGGIEIHEGPPTGMIGSRVAIIQNHPARTWAVTAAVVHPGLGMRDADSRRVMGNGLTELLDQMARTELVDEVLFLIRTVPDDGAERDEFVARHRRADSLPQVRQINDEMQEQLTSASVRTEAFVTIVVPEGRIGRQAREHGGGLEGRAQIMYALMGECEALLRGAMGMTDVRWLTSPELATACRTGFAPGDRAAIVDAVLAASRGQQVNVDVPWALAGPSGADAAVRHYSHDAWNSVSSTIILPPRGAVMGALAPALTPTSPGERRAILVAYPILSHSKATRTANTNEWTADMAQALRHKVGQRSSTAVRDSVDQVRRTEGKVARGHSMSRPYAVCTVTAPKTSRAAAHGRALDASIRRSGFAPLRLDIGHETAFAVSVLPLGVSLNRAGEA